MQNEYEEFVERTNREWSAKPEIHPSPEAPIVLPTTWTIKNTYDDSTPVKYRYWPPIIEDREIIIWLRNPGYFAPMWVLTSDFRAGLGQETKWVADSRPWPQNPEQVGRGESTCSVCGGAGVYHEIVRGETTGIVRRRPQGCICKLLQQHWQRWCTLAPQRFRDCSLETVEPRTDMQTKVIECMREHPTDSYFLYGESGTGKSHLMWCLAHKLTLWNLLTEHGIPLPGGAQPVAVFGPFRASVWLDELAAWQTRDMSENCSLNVKVPAVTAQRIERVARERGFRPICLINELDRWNATNANRVERIQELIDVTYESNGAIITTSNLGPSELATKWGGMQAKVALRRIAGEGGHGFEF